MSDLSRVEQLLRNALGEDIYEVTPQSRVEILLAQLNELIEGLDTSVSPEDIATAVSAYLDEHLTNPTSPPVDTSLAIAGAAADAKKTGDEIGALKEGLSAISADLAQSVYDLSWWEKGKISSSNGGNYSDGATIRTIGYIQDKYTQLIVASDYKIRVFGYDATFTFVGCWNGTAFVKSDANLTGTVDISTINGAYFLRIAIMKTNNASITTDDASNVLFVSNKLAELGDAINTVGGKANDLFGLGYTTLENATWQRGAWYGKNDFRPAIKYRVSAVPQVVVDKDTVLVCAKGYKMNYWYITNDGETVVTVSNVCNALIPAGATLFVTMCRIVESMSEVLTNQDVITFGKALHSVAYHSTEYTNYRDTFAGIETYEKMGIIGDSYSAGNNTNNWGKCLDRMIGTSVTVWAHSGYTSANWINEYLPQLLATDALDLYWINLGINDGARVVSDSSYLGTSADIDEETYTDIDTFPDTFWGNMGRIIRNIQNHAPNSKIVLEKTMFMTMLNAQRNIDTTKLLDINNAIIAIGECYGIPVIDQLDDAFYCSPEYLASMAENHPRKYIWTGMANANRRLFTRTVLANPVYFY